METKGRALFKALVIGGAVIGGSMINSNHVEAAEIDEVEPNEKIAVSVQENTVSNLNENSETVLQEMDDAAGVVEGDAVATENYLQQAVELPESDNMALNNAKEIIDNSDDIYDQACEKKDEVDEKYEELKKYSEGLKADYYQNLIDNDMSELMTECENSDNNQEKIEVIEESQKIESNQYDDYMKLYGEESAEYNNISAGVVNSAEKYDNATKELSEAEDKYEKACIEEENIKSKYSEIFSKDDEYSNTITDLNSTYRMKQGDMYDHDYEYELLKCEDDLSVAEYDVQELNAKKEESEKRQEELLKKLESEENEAVRLEYNSELSNHSSIQEEIEIAINKKIAIKIKKESLQKEYDAKKTELDELKNKILDVEDEYESWKEEVSIDSCRKKYREVGENTNLAYTDLEIADNKCMKYKEDLEAAKARKEELDKTNQNKRERHLAFTSSCINYKNSLLQLAQAGIIKENTEKEFYDIVESRNSLKSIVANKIVKILSDCENGIRNNVAKEEEYINQAQIAKENGTFANESVDELKRQVDNLVEESKSKKVTIEEVGHKIFENVKSVENDFYKLVYDYGLEEYVQRIKDAEDLEEKLLNINAFKEYIGLEFEKSKKEYGFDSNEYQSLVEDIKNTGIELTKVQKNYLLSESVYEENKGIITNYKELEEYYTANYGKVLTSLKRDLDYRKRIFDNATDMLARIPVNSTVYSSFYDYYTNTKNAYENSLGIYEQKVGEMEVWKTSFNYAEIEKQALAAIDEIDSLAKDLEASKVEYNNKKQTFIELCNKKADVELRYESSQKEYNKILLAVDDYVKAVDLYAQVHSILGEVDKYIMNSELLLVSFNQIIEDTIKDNSDEYIPVKDEEQLTKMEYHDEVTFNFTKETNKAFNGTKGVVKGEFSIKTDVCARSLSKAISNIEDKVYLAKISITAIITIGIQNMNGFIKTYVDKGGIVFNMICGFLKR